MLPARKDNCGDATVSLCSCIACVLRHRSRCKSACRSRAPTDRPTDRWPGLLLVELPPATRRRLGRPPPPACDEICSKARASSTHATDFTDIRMMYCRPSVVKVATARRSRLTERLQSVYDDERLSLKRQTVLTRCPSACFCAFGRRFHVTTICLLIN